MTPPSGPGLTGHPLYTMRKLLDALDHDATTSIDRSFRKETSAQTCIWSALLPCALSTALTGGRPHLGGALTFFNIGLTGGAPGR